MPIFIPCFQQLGEKCYSLRLQKSNIHKFLLVLPPVSESMNSDGSLLFASMKSIIAFLVYYLSFILHHIPTLLITVFHASLEVTLPSAISTPAQLEYPLPCPPHHT